MEGREPPLLPILMILSALLKPWKTQTKATTVLQWHVTLAVPKPWKTQPKATTLRTSTNKSRENKISKKLRRESKRVEKREQREKTLKLQTHHLQPLSTLCGSNFLQHPSSPSPLALSHFFEIRKP